MPDEIDQAQEINEQLRQDALAEHYRRGMRNAMYRAEIECIECGEEIPEARRRAVAGCLRCLTCQERFEMLSNWR